MSRIVSSSPPTQKVRRDYVLPKYADDIDALFS